MTVIKLINFLKTKPCAARTFLNSFIMKLLPVILCSFIFTSCEESEIAQSINAGKIISVTEVQTSWNDSHRTKIVTTKGVFYVNSVVSSMNGADVWIDEYQNGLRHGMRYICIAGKKECERIIGD